MTVVAEQKGHPVCDVDLGALTRFCGDEVGGLGLEVLDDDVVVEDGLGVVGHLREQVAVEHHLAVVEVEASHLIDKG